MSAYRYSSRIAFKLNDITYKLRQHRMVKCAIFKCLEDAVSDNLQLELTYNFNPSTDLADAEYVDKTHIKYIIGMVFDIIEGTPLQTINKIKYNEKLDSDKSSVIMWKLIDFAAFMGIASHKIELFIKNVEKDKDGYFGSYSELRDIVRSTKQSYMDAKEFYVRTLLDHTLISKESRFDIGFSAQVIKQDYLSYNLKILLLKYICAYFCRKIRRSIQYGIPSDIIKNLIYSIRDIGPVLCCISSNIFHLSRHSPNKFGYFYGVDDICVLLSSNENGKYGLVVKHQNVNFYADIEDTDFITTFIKLCFEIHAKEYVMLRMLDVVPDHLTQIYPPT